MKFFRMLGLIVCVFACLADFSGCKSKIEFPAGEPDNSTPANIVKSALEYQLEYARDYSLLVAKDICTNYLEFYEQIKNVVTENEKEHFRKKYLKFKQFLSLNDAFLESFNKVSIEIIETRKISVESKQDFKQVLNFIYQNLAVIRKSTFQGISAKSDDKEISKRKLLFYATANQFLKSLGVKDEIFSKDGVKDVEELIFAYPSKLESAARAFQLVSAKFDKPVFNADANSVNNEAKSQDFLVFQSAGRWFLTDFDISTFEVIDANFSNINFYCVPETSFENTTAEQALETAVKLFLFENSRLFSKNSVEASITRYEDIIKNVKIANAWCSSVEDAEEIQKYQASFAFMQHNVNKLGKFSYKIISESPKKESVREYSVQLETYNFKENKSSDVEKPSSFVLVKKLEELSIRLKFQDGKWLIARINMVK